jgi:hypothetical protein
MKSRRMHRKVHRKAHRKATRKASRKANRKMRGGNTPSETYRSPLFVNLTDRYGPDIMQGPALSQ